MQSIRQAEGLPRHETPPHNQEHNSYISDRQIPVNVHDFQTAHHWTPSRRPSTPKLVTSTQRDANGAPPMPGLNHPPWKNTPTVPRLVIIN